jgi:hypothetical protein
MKSKTLKSVLMLALSCSTLCLLGLTTLGSAQTTITDGLVAYWPLDDVTCDGVNGHHGVIVGGIGFVDGKVGKAAEFNGSCTKSSINIPYDPELQPQTLSIQAWVRNLGDYYWWGDFFVNGVIKNNGGFALYTMYDQAWFRATTATSRCYRGAISLSDEEWHHVIGTVDSDGTRRLYVDGVLRYTWSNCGTDLGINYLAETIYIGCGWDWRFHAQIDEVGLWNRALTEDEVSELWNGGEGRSLNLPPTADAGGPYSVAEGGSVPLDGSGSTDNEQDPATLTYEWDFDQDGQYDDATGIAPTFPATALDGPSSVTVGLKVTDDYGESDTDTATVNITNVAPTANFANTSGTVFEGESATLAFSNESDPSTADTAAGFRYSYDCTDDGTFELASDPAPSFECPYPSAGTFTARGIIEDKDGGSTDYTVVVTVLSPQGAADTVIDDVQDMVDAGTLNQGQGTALISKLDAAIAKLNQGKDKPAIKLLGAFINQVNDLIDTGVLTAEEGQPLIDTANRIIDSIG